MGAISLSGYVFREQAAMGPEMSNVRSDDSATTVEWYSPRWLVGPGSALGVFDLDPCCPSRNHHTAEKCLSLKEGDDGLAADWDARACVWLNPPYGKDVIDPWMTKMGLHASRGGSGIVFIFVRMETKYMQEALSSPWVSAVFFLEGRVAFDRGAGVGSDKGAPAGSILIAYGPEGLRRLARAYAAGLISGVLYRRYDQHEAMADASQQPGGETDGQSIDDLLGSMTSDQERAEFLEWYERTHRDADALDEAKLARQTMTANRRTKG